MKILGSRPRNKQPTSAGFASPKDTDDIQSPLLRLPLELRRKVYTESILASRSPNSGDVYHRNLRAIWEDLPSPLLRVNKQIRNEVFDVLQGDTFTLRVTSYGASFDMLGLSSFIAQQRPKSYGALPELWIEIWPPHPDRPIEMYNINYYLRNLRDELRATQVGIPKLVVEFQETEFAKWTQDGLPRCELLDPDDRLRGDISDAFLSSDISKVLNHFACVTNVAEAHIVLPPSSNDFENYATAVCETMEGKGTLAEEAEFALLDFGISDLYEDCLKTATAERARAKLDEITRHGKRKMADDEWFAFTEVWPHFETLSEVDHGGAFKGEDHYRSYKATDPDSPSLR